MNIDELERLKAENERLRAENQQMREEGFDAAQSQVFGNILIMPFPEKLEDFRDVSINLDESLQAIVNEGLTGMNRHQKNAIGDIRLGFVHDIARYVQDETQFNPSTGFDPEYYSKLIVQLDMLSQTQTALSSALRLARDISIVTGDMLYGLALLWYRNIQVLSERRVPGAEAIYRQLRTHFRHRRASTSEEPTEAQVLRDVKAVLHGKKDGEIVVAGHARHTTQGSHTVVDDVHKPMQQNFKETVRGVICTHCNTHNAAGHKFCWNCGKELIVE